VNLTRRRTRSGAGRTPAQAASAKLGDVFPGRADRTPRLAVETGFTSMTIASVAVGHQVDADEATQIPERPSRAERIACDAFDARGG
jgi:hypothetical protein